MAKRNLNGTLGANVPEEVVEQLNKMASENPKEDKEATATRPSYRSKPRYRKPDNVEDALKVYPKHIVKLVNIVKSNSDIRRYCSLGILNYLSQKNILEEAKGYVTFDWTKFSVTNRGLRTEYRYTEHFFINCLIASFTSFANAAQKIIGEFCSKEFEDKFTEDKEIMNAAIEAAEAADEASIDKELTE